MINAFRISVGKKEAEVPLERLGRKWEANVKLVLKKTGFKKLV
jgi:hypothetical protein